MRIGIIGHGNVGGALGRRWEQADYEVVYGVRDRSSPSTATFRQQHGGNPNLATVVEAMAESEIVLLATPYAAALELAGEHAGVLAGKIVIDATNPIGPGLVLSVGHTASGAEQLAARAPGAHVVKAFNTYGWENFQDAGYPGGKPVMFIAGDQASATDAVASLAERIGFVPVVTGDLTMARFLEPLAMLWIKMGRVQGRGSGFAWAMLTR
jgi:predicted dinucleotide-binding enzyme